MRIFHPLSFVAIATMSFAITANSSAQEWKSGIEWKQPKVVTPGEANIAPPSDAIVLFDGTNLSLWENGEKWLVADGVAIPKESQIITKQKFGDIQLHVEWSSPKEVRGSSQGRGNSGIFLMSLYEVQVLDSFQNQTYFDGQAASIYKQTPPLVNAMRKPGEWNTYDIFFTAPVFRGNGEIETPAYITLVHNGVLALNHFEILGPTYYTVAPSYEAHAEKEPISIQFHGNPVRFRNIWVRELSPTKGKRVRGPFNITPKPKAKPKGKAKPKAKAKAKPKTKPKTKPKAKPKTKPAAKPKVTSTKEAKNEAPKK